MKISTRQLLFFLLCIAPVGKIILMPSQLVYFAKNDLLLSAALNYALQTGLVFLVLLLSKSNQTFYALLQERFGRIAAKIIVTVFALFLFYAALLPLLEQKLFVQSVFYDTLPSLIAFSPFFLFSAYLCFQPLSLFGRTWDILAPLSIAGYAGIMLLSAGEADYGALLPVGVSGAKGVFGGAAFTESWFFDAVILLLLIGRFDYQKGLAWKGALCYFLSGLAVLFLLAVFYGIFADIALRQLFAFSKISKYFSGITVLGRIDYLFIYTLALVMAFYCALPLQAGVQALKDVYGEGEILSACFAAGISLMMFALTVLLDDSFVSVQKTVAQTLFWIFPIFYLLSALSPLLLVRKSHET